MLTQDYQSIFVWWITITSLGLLGLPLVYIIFGRFLDKGYGIAKTAGILCVSYFIFVLSTFRLIPFSKTSILIIIAFYSAINIYIFIKKRTKITAWISKNALLLVLEEVLFAGGLIFWAYVRAHQPDINGLEKFMDFGFVNSFVKADYLPATDMWFSGKGINYYWYGHFVTGLLIKLTGINSGVGYNLMLGTILGLSLSSAFSLISSLVYNLNKKVNKKAAIVAGVISAVLLNFAGNFHTPYYVLKNGVDKYWYPDATRFIGYNPDIADKTIHEFPIYSYVVSDLHAHLLNLPFVLLFLSLLYAFVSLDKKKLKSPWSFNYSKLMESLQKTIANSQFKIVLIIGALLGIMFMTNAWDFANYLLVSGFVFLFYFVRKGGVNFDVFYKTAVPLMIIISLALITSLPFTINFESIAQGIKLTHTKTPFWQLAILYGFPAILTVTHLTKLVFSKIKREDIFILSLITSAWALIFIPEFIYIKDIYSETHYRANTMFKLTYQAYVMSYLASGYIVISALKNIKRIVPKIALVLVFSAIFSSLLHYPVISVKSYYAELKNPPRSLSGDTWLNEKSPDLYTTIEWLKNNVSGQPTILEAPGDSYTEFNSASSYTGFPTVSGWYVHEWLWRGTPDAPQERVNDIISIYTAEDISITKSLLEKYNVSYVIVGDQEREKYSNLIESKFLELGELVSDTPTTKLYKIN